MLMQFAFQSTPPSRVATTFSVLTMQFIYISIHTTLAGGDRLVTRQLCTCTDFNPHHPRGWRLGNYNKRTDTFSISIHTTLAGGDGLLRSRLPQKSRFQSTPPSRVATGWPVGTDDYPKISIHTTLAGGDRMSNSCFVQNADFNPHHPRGWRQKSEELHDFYKNFNPHHPRGWRQQKWTRNSSIFYSY